MHRVDILVRVDSVDGGWTSETLFGFIFRKQNPPITTWKRRYEQKEQSKTR